MLDNPTALTPETPLPAMALLQAESPTPENPKSLKSCVHSALTHYYQGMGTKTPKDVYHLVLSQVEPPLIKSTLEYTRGNQSKAAVLLGISRGNFRMKCRRYHITLDPANTRGYAAANDHKEKAVWPHAALTKLS